ncbi:DgyrCDS7603 [Dimorphilus gyrociliatus]|uniref:DgyrCDS7603 n=1 Tax=Dimorphilus gyrociliatus TaxID=2664684 RepID=A0A7I8VRH3_9ANNE|nr:DgyrCDS7603 [Dimorphilus gyrociliatus]
MNNLYDILLFAILGFAGISAKSLTMHGSRRGAYFPSFGDYLVTTATNSKYLMEIEGKKSQPLIPSKELINYFQKVPKRHWSCCMLGTLAGFKGFLCDARYYEDSIAFTNVNRPVNGSVRKNIQKHKKWTVDIMHQFSRCIKDRRRRHQFDICCEVEDERIYELRKYNIN